MLAVALDLGEPARMRNLRVCHGIENSMVTPRLPIAGDQRRIPGRDADAHRDLVLADVDERLGPIRNRITGLDAAVASNWRAAVAKRDAWRSHPVTRQAKARPGRHPPRSRRCECRR